MEKTHYRKVYKSDHLGVADLEDELEKKSNLIYTIKYVRAEYGTRVAGKKGDFNIAYFEEPIKPLVINATNAKILKKFSGSSFLEDWKGIKIQLYIDKNVKLGGEIVEGVRIHPNPPRVKYNLTPNCDKWLMAKQKKSEGWTIEMFRKSFDITQENFEAL